MYQEAERITGLSYGTLKNFSSISQTIGFSLRSEKLSQEAERITGYAYGHLADMKRISEIIGFTVRTVNLSYNHHKAVASIIRT